MKRKPKIGRDFGIKVKCPWWKKFILHLPILNYIYTDDILVEFTVYNKEDSIIFNTIKFAKIFKWDQMFYADFASIDNDAFSYVMQIFSVATRRVVAKSASLNHVLAGPWYPQGFIINHDDCHY